MDENFSCKSVYVRKNLFSRENMKRERNVTLVKNSARF